ncbi:LysR family transcriptional regulator [Dactylosporangium siamense]|uniref:LysR family transcriptional regulator n=2 Tax=Dactylosporangium siamense TaxID=685454 RepID=A0A919PFA1_9ACTN|nr:LysR family transcriptional regulator [Dactylosporangium siamense]
MTSRTWPDLDVRLLRHFVAVADELHFGRAAARLFIAQQALSRDVQRLEERVGMALFDRTSRRVALTPAGELLLPRARRLLVLHDETVRELRGGETTLLVNVVAPGLTPARVLTGARAQEPATEFFARFEGGMGRATALLGEHRLDATFGRQGAAESSVRGAAASGLAHRLIRWEPLALLVPVRSALAEQSAVPLAALRDAQVCWLAGDHVTPEWEDAARRLLQSCGAPVDGGGAHPYVHSIEELAYHVQVRESPVLTLLDQAPVPGAVLRPLVEPGAVYPWSLVWRAGEHHRPGLRALLESAAELAAAEGWLTVPELAWRPDA